MNSKLNELLIANVKKYKFLYDVSIPEYRDLVKKHNAWKRIGAQLNVNVEVCRKRWKTLRDTYKKYMRRKKLNDTSSNIKRFKWAESMSFMKCDCRVRQPSKAMSFDFNDRLIEEVRKNERLYNPSIPGYRRASRRARTWKRISETLNADEEMCKKRWKTLRDAHKKFMRFESDNLSGETQRKYRYEKALSFLNNITKCNRTVDTFLEESDSEDDELWQSKSTQKEDMNCTDDSLSSLYSMALKSEQYDSKEQSDEELKTVYGNEMETMEACDIEVCDNISALPPNVKTPTLEVFESLAFKLRTSGLSSDQIDVIEYKVLTLVREKIAYYRNRNS